MLLKLVHRVFVRSDESATVQINDVAANGGHNYTITSNTVTRNGASQINYTNISTVTLNGGAGGNTINVQGLLRGTSAVVNAGSGNDTITVGSDAGPGGTLAPVSGPVTVSGQDGTDNLILNDQGAADRPTYTLTAASVARTNGPTVNFSLMENVTLNGGGNGNLFLARSTDALVTTTVNAGAGDDRINVGSADDATSALDNLRGALTINGQAGDDTITLNDQGALDNKGGANSRIYTLTRTTFSWSTFSSLTYGTIEHLGLNGAGGGNLISVQGTGNGVITSVNAGLGSDTISVGDTTNSLGNIGGPLFVSGQAGTDTLNIDDEASGPGLQHYTVFEDNVARQGGPTINYDTIKNLALTGGGGNDVIDVPETASGVNTTVSGGGGDDTINVGNDGDTLDDLAGPLDVEGGAGTDTLNVNDQGTFDGQTYTVSNNSVARQVGPTVNYGLGFSAPENVILNGGSGDNEVFVTSTNLLTNTTVNSGAGDDTITAGNANDQLSDIQGPLTVDGGDGDTDQLILHDEGYFRQGGTFYTVTDSTVARPGVGPIIYLLLTELDLHAGSGGNTITVEATAPATTTNVFYGSEQGDTFNVGNAGGRLDDILGPLNLYAGGQDTLNVNDWGSTDAHAYAIADDTIQRDNGPGIGYSFFRSVNVKGGGGGNAVVVEGNGALFQMTVNAGTGNDTVDVEATGANTLTLIQGGAGDDTINVGNGNNQVDDIHGSVDVDGGSGSNTLNVNDQGTTGAKAYTVQNTVVSRGTNAFAVTYSNINSLTLNGGSGGNTVKVLSTAAGTDTFVNSATGDDTITVTGAGPNAHRIDDIQGTLIIDAQRPPFVNTNDTIIIDDRGSPGPYVYRAPPVGVSRSNGPTIYTSGYQNRTLWGAPRSSIQVLGVSPGTSLTVNGSGGGDTFIVGNDSNQLDDIQGALTLNAGGPGDVVRFNDQGHGGGDSYTMADDTLAVGRLPDFDVTFNGMSQFALNTGSGGDSVSFDSPNPDQDLAVDAGSGYDTVVMASGTVTDPQLSNIDALQITGGTLALGSGLTVQALSESGGELTGSGTVTATATASWTGGTMSGAGTTSIAPGATLTVSGSETLTRTLANVGTGTWNGSIDGGTGLLANSGSLSTVGSLAGALFDTGRLSPGGDGTIGGISVTGDYSEAGTLHVDLLTPDNSDGVTPSGTVTLGGGLDVVALAGFSGNSFTVIANTGSGPVVGTFAGLPQGAPIMIGGREFHISYVGGDGNDVVLSFKYSTTTAVSSTPNPSLVTQPVTFTATVSSVGGGNTPTGTVTFTVDGTNQGTALLSNGAATFTTSSLVVGNHTVVATYNGDDTHKPSNSNSLTQVVKPAPTSTSVTSSLNPSYYTQTVTFTATVTALPPVTGTPTGTVVFYADGVSLGSAPLSGGVATLSTGSLYIGNHTITASYSGDAIFAASSGTLSQVVKANNTTTSLSSSLNPSYRTQSVTFTATVAPSGTPLTRPPTGSVTFYADGFSLGSATLSGGVATFSTASLAAGSHSITASYSGDSTFAGSSSGTLTQVVNLSNTTTSVTSSLNPSYYTQSVTFTATVSPSGTPVTGPPTGTVSFRDGGVTLGNGTLSNGVATFSLGGLFIGNHNISAFYNGDSTFAGSSSSTLTQTVNPNNTTTSLTSSLNPSYYTQTVTFTATVAPSGTPFTGRRRAA
jgi:hypothetical protein